MDSKQFDDLTKAIGVQVSRRSVLKLIYTFVLSSILGWIDTIRRPSIHATQKRVQNIQFASHPRTALSNASDYKLEEVDGSQADVFKGRAEQNVDFKALRQLIEGASGDPNTVVLQLLENEILSRYSVAVTYPGKAATDDIHTLYYVSEVDSNGADETISAFVITDNNAGEPQYGFFKDENGNLTYQSAVTIPDRVFLPLVLNQKDENAVLGSYDEENNNLYSDDFALRSSMVALDNSTCTEADKGFAEFQCARCSIGVGIVCAGTVGIHTLACEAIGLLCAAGKKDPRSISAGAGVAACTFFLKQVFCKKKLGEDFCQSDPCSKMCDSSMCNCTQCLSGCEVCDLSNDFSSWTCRDISRDNKAVCNGKCVNLAGDKNNCSGCGNQCSQNQLCKGTCTDACLEGYLACPNPFSASPLCLYNPANNWKCCSHPVTGEPLGACPTGTLCCFPPSFTTLGCCILQYQCENGVCW